jgi:hypothetical protein
MGYLPCADRYYTDRLANRYLSAEGSSIAASDDGDADGEGGGVEGEHGWSGPGRKGGAVPDGLEDGLSGDVGEEPTDRVQ